MNVLKYFAVLLSLNLLAGNVRAYEFSEQRIALALKPVLEDERFSAKSHDDIVTIANSRLIPELEQYLIPKMLYPLIPYTVSVNPLAIKYSDPEKPEAGAKIIDSKKLLSVYLKKIISLCDVFFRQYPEKLNDDERLWLLVDLHNILLEHLQPRLEEAYIKFWKTPKQKHNCCYAASAP